ncbi:hypothetical protein PEX1_095340 [Penicillium expansum]|uniref:Uncharacterized protein n=1 Tax=Penicillium expansum TaxID=27334 RepID=A0A0A2ISV6_PENEN|nr:hypothetical protein PEX2_109650 [Penicillium expansum]KGO43260.1 hypothetical protein PEXP_028900 [Penicillium expansum]KGO52316.1 hypothetical protein PEX2_109650 [Penicillium expansum]KGO56488.1 hypothetical protein PEX1_095340 [Penicillium expansum]
MLEATPEDNYLAQLIAAAPSAGGSFARSIPLSSRFIQPGIPPMNEHFDLAVPTTVPPPTTQMTDLAGLHSWDLEFPISSGSMTKLTSQDAAMDDYLPTTSSFPSLDVGIADHAELQALEGWPLFQCNPVTPSSAELCKAHKTHSPAQPDPQMGWALDPTFRPTDGL